MQFIFPLFLAALATLAIPVIIHLFYFRRYKKVLFTNVRFLREIKEESSIRSRLKNLLILLCRLLVLLFLVLAFAQPFLKKDDHVLKGLKLISLFVDNSFSMASLSSDAPLLEEARQKARDLVFSYDPDDRFQVITHELLARQQRLLSRDQALAVIDAIELTPSVHRLSEVFQRQKQALNDENNPNKLIYYLTDFQENITDLDLSDTTFEYNLLPLQAVIEQNVSIDSAWFEAPVQMLQKPNKLLVRLHNWSDRSVENIQLTMKTDETVKPVGSLDLPANSTLTDTVFITVAQPGWQRVELKITDFPVQFDDTYYLAFEVRQQVQTLHIYEGQPNRYLTSAFNNAEFFVHSPRNMSNLDYSAFPQFQLIVLDAPVNIPTGLTSALKSYIEQGGNLLLFPSRRAEPDSYNTFLSSLQAGSIGEEDTTSRVVNYYNADEFIFNDVFEQNQGNLRLPATKGNFPVADRGGRAEKLLGYRDGSAYLLKYPVGQGRFYFCSAPLDLEVNNLVTQAEIFIPMIYKMALSASGEKKIAYTIGSDQWLEMENRSTTADVIYQVTGPTSFIPGQQSRGKQVLLHFFDQAPLPGFYDVYLREGEILNTFAFNSNRLESNPACIPVSRLQDLYGDGALIIDRTQQASLAEFVGEKDRGIILWKYCLFLALFFLALETLIIRFWKVS